MTITNAEGATGSRKASELQEPPALTRRRFFSMLAASVVAASLPLPVGFPRELPQMQIGQWENVTFRYLVEFDIATHTGQATPELVA